MLCSINQMTYKFHDFFVKYVMCNVTLCGEMSVFYYKYPGTSYTVVHHQREWKI